MAKFNLSEEHIIGWRRHLHQHPEVSFKEVETAKYVSEILASFGVYELMHPTPTSVIATLKGATPGKVIALRADMDALPIHEEADVDFKSLNDGVMHACGHDAHTAMLLGAAEALAQMKDELSGTVKLIFQHAEELLPGGAREIVAAGVLDDVDLVFGLHVFPMMKTGSVGYLTGPLTAASDTFTLKIQGRGAHGSMPDLSIDPINIGVEIINSINHIISREISPFDTAVISMGKFNSGNAANVIPDTAELMGTVRTLNPDTRVFIKERIYDTIANICNIYKATFDLDYKLGYDPVINDDVATSYVIEAAKKLLPSDAIFEGKTMMGGEDFSAYTNVKPGSFFMLGVGLAEDGYGYINHHPKFKIDEAALIVGAEMFVQLIVDLLG